MTWTHLFKLRNGELIACRPHKPCPSCRLRVRLQTPTKAERRDLIRERVKRISRGVYVFTP